MSDDTHSGESEPSDDEVTGGPGEVPDNVHDGLQKGRERLEKGADKAVDSFDEGIVDLLSWVLDTETRARIYVYLRQQPESTSEEIAEGTGLYPSTVREALAELTEEGKVTRQKRESAGAGNNPYEYEAIAPSELVSSVVGDVQQELNTVFNLDRHLGGETVGTDSEPISITVEDASGDASEDVADESVSDAETGDDEHADE